MATARLTLGSLLGTVTTAAETATGALSTVSDIVGMANSYVHEASENQRIRQIADREVFVENLINEKAQERTMAYVQVEEFCKKSASHAKHYHDSYDLFTNLLREKKDDNISRIRAAE